ncbi:hypothetical protein Lal_00021387, partial [Lupinus albus]
RVERCKALSLEMVFIDQKGDKIQATVKNLLIPQWKSQLKEGFSYIAKNFDVVLNEGQYRCCNHRYKLIFRKRIVLENKVVCDIPNYIYHLIVFEDILNGVALTDFLVDLQLVLKGYPVTIQNTMYGSKLYINDSIPEIELFCRSLDYTKSYKSYNQCMSWSSLSSKVGSQDKIFHNDDLKTVCLTYSNFSHKLSNHFFTSKLHMFLPYIVSVYGF